MNVKKIATMLIVLVLSFAMFSVAYADETVTVSNAAKLEEVLTEYSNKTTGKNLGKVTINITAGSVIEGNFVIPQRVGTNLIIEGNGSTIKGRLEIDGDSNDTPETLTIKNLVFDATGLSASLDYLIGQNSADGDTSGLDNSVRYPHNVTIDNCTFKGNSELPAIKLRQSLGTVTISNCQTDGMHSLLQAYGCNQITVDSCVITGGRGLSLGTSKDVTVKNTKFAIADDEYAIRTDLNTGNGPAAYSVKLTITDNTFCAGQPIVVRYASTVSDHSLTVTGNTYEHLTVEESDKVVTPDKGATLDMFTGEEQAISDDLNTFKQSPGADPEPEPEPEPSSAPSTTTAPTPTPAPVAAPPKAGDESHLFGWMALMVLSFAGVVIFGKKRFSNR
ncbi:MAG: right-handed parallel beta-helix repeat-containing protein [Clostridia bacterium]|nr:right-handed parallel beta-helix repeat-containing protein [Clostridia bacterium]